MRSPRDYSRLTGQQVEVTIAVRAPEDSPPGPDGQRRAVRLHYRGRLDGVGKREGVQLSEVVCLEWSGTWKGDPSIPYPRRSHFVAGISLVEEVKPLG